MLDERFREGFARRFLILRVEREIARYARLCILHDSSKLGLEPVDVPDKAVEALEAAIDVLPVKLHLLLGFRDMLF